MLPAVTSHPIHKVNWVFQCLVKSVTSLANLGRDFEAFGIFVWSVWGFVPVVLFSAFGLVFVLFLNGWLINYLVSNRMKKFSELCLSPFQSLSLYGFCIRLIIIMNCNSEHPLSSCRNNTFFKSLQISFIYYYICNFISNYFCTHSASLKGMKTRASLFLFAHQQFEIQRRWNKPRRIAWISC